MQANDLQITKLFSHFDKLQLLHGEPSLKAIYGAGQIQNPKICFVFMNPTARNISADPNWNGIRAPWIGTKTVWSMFADFGFLDEDLLTEVQNLKPNDWTESFAYEVYRSIADNSIYITNLSKATQLDARPLSDKVFRQYLELFHQEIQQINPQLIITFGNQVSTIAIGQKISVSQARKQIFNVQMGSREYKVLPVYYPVGQGRRNLPLAVEDVAWGIKISQTH